MIKNIIFFFILFNIFSANASPNKKIANNFNKIETLKFKFIQQIDNNKILVSNGKSLVINSDKINNYLRYSLKKTPLNFILDKKFIISKIYELKEDLDYPFYYVFDVKYENISTKIFFDKKNLDLIGWETTDVYQNKVQTFISDIQKNISVDNKIFVIQKYIN